MVGTRADVCYTVRLARDDFAGFCTPLRVVLALVPTRYWHEIVMPNELWLKLMGGEAVLPLLRGEKPAQLDADFGAARDLGLPIERDRFVAANLMYLLACGVMTIRPAADGVQTSAQDAEKART